MINVVSTHFLFLDRRKVSSFRKLQFIESFVGWSPVHAGLQIKRDVERSTFKTKKVSHPSHWIINYVFACGEGSLCNGNVLSYRKGPKVTALGKKRNPPKVVATNELTVFPFLLILRNRELKEQLKCSSQTDRWKIVNGFNSNKMNANGLIKMRVFLENSFYVLKLSFLVL